jgi:hypothetical protein
MNRKEQIQDAIKQALDQNRTYLDRNNQLRLNIVMDMYLTTNDEDVRVITGNTILDIMHNHMQIKT